MRVLVKRLDNRAIIPTYAHVGRNGDLAADLSSVEQRRLVPGDIVTISTGLAMQFPSGYGAILENRSGLSIRGLSLLGGVIDPGYTGEIRVVLAYFGKSPFLIRPGDRVAQLRIVKRIEASFVEAVRLRDRARGTRGFGSTGLKHSR
jgi:dUTP pyrophosphatase